MGTVRTFHLQTLAPLTESLPSLTKTLKWYSTGRQKCPHPGQKALWNLLGTSCGRVLVVFHFHGQSEDPCIAGLLAKSRRLRGFIPRTFLISASFPTRALSTIKKVSNICSSAFFVCTFFLHCLFGSGDDKTVATWKTSQIKICNENRRIKALILARTA